MSYGLCPFCGGRKIEGESLLNCFGCGTKWERYGSGRIVKTLEFDSAGTEWWWNIVDEGLLVVREYEVVGS